MGMNTSPAPLDRLDRLLSIDELSDYLGVPIKTIYDWRSTGHGPAAFKIGRHLKFAESDVLRWLNDQRQDHDGTPGR